MVVNGPHPVITGLLVRREQTPVAALVLNVSSHTLGHLRTIVTPSVRAKKGARVIVAKKNY